MAWRIMCQEGKWYNSRSRKLKEVARDTQLRRQLLSRGLKDGREGAMGILGEGNSR